MPQKPTIDDYVNAVLDRDGGIPYSAVIETHGITPNQFARAVRLGFGDLIEAASGDKRKTLLEILADDKRILELFRMDEEFLRQQYLRVNDKKPGKQRRIYDGTYIHPENVEHLVYFALTFNAPSLSSSNRAEVVQGINNLPVNLKDYLRSIGLAGLMMNGFEKGEKNSPLAVLKAFDRAYQRKTGDASLLDQTQQHKLELGPGNRLIR